VVSDYQIMDIPSHHKHQVAAESLPPLRISVVTVSDSRNPNTDRNGPYLKREIESAGHELVGFKIIRDEPADIELTLDQQVDKGAHVILFNGGTGISKRDGTYDTICTKFSTIIPGFGEIFRQLSYQQIGSAAMLSRAIAGVYRNTIVFLTPGSPKAVSLAWEKLISKEIRHMVWDLNR